jgi:hypothetical protein
LQGRQLAYKNKNFKCSRLTFLYIFLPGNDPYGLKHEAILNKNNVFIIKLVVLTASLLVHDLLLCAGNEEQDDIHIQLPFIKGENLLVS